MKDLEPVFNAAGDDWYRYSAASWVVWTERTAMEWYALLRPYIVPSEYVWIFAIDMNERFGWMPKAFWDWADSKREISRDYLAPVGGIGGTGGGLGSPR